MTKGGNPVEQALAAFIERQGMREGRMIWLAVSGGADSMALLHAAGQGDGAFGVLHVDHGLRPDSADDLAFVRAAAEARQLPFESITLNGLASSEARKNAGLEAAARSARYAWMAQVAGPDGVVLTAHHRDDQRETRLLHLLRGSRAEALAGMKEVHRDFGFTVGRPFLSLPMKALRSALSEAGVPWREDASNAAPDFLRNRIRHELIPLLDDMRPGWEAGLERIGNVASEWRGFMDGFLAQKGVAHAAFPLELLSSCPSPLHALGIWGEAFGFGTVQAAALFELAAPGTEVGRKRCAEAWCVVRERDALVAQPLRTDEGRAPQSWMPGEGSESGTLSTPDGALHWSLHRGETGMRPDPDEGVAELWMDALCGPLVLRPWQEGDRLAPLGMEGHQLVSDVLTQRKVPATARAGQWVVETAEGQLAWLAGHRIDRRAALPADPAGGRILRLEWRPTG